MASNQDSSPEFFVGWMGGFRFKVKLSEKSAVDGVKHTVRPISGLKARSVLPVAHLLVVAENKSLPWEEFSKTGAGMGDLVTLADQSMDRIIKHFLPSLKLGDAAWRYEIESSIVAPREAVRVHIIVGHHQLFGPTGFIRRCVDDIRRPELIAEEATVEYERVKEAKIWARDDTIF